MFREFYRVYPRKVGKLDAEKAFRQMTSRGYEPEAIINGAKKFAAIVAAEGKEMQFIPHPASWLRAGRWMDEEHETIKPEPVVRCARTLDELKEYRTSSGLGKNAEIERAKSLDELPVFLKMIPVSWNVTPLKARA